jgi:hypothetical protein
MPFPGRITSQFTTTSVPLSLSGVELSRFEELAEMTADYKVRSII